MIRAVFDFSIDLTCVESCPFYNVSRFPVTLQWLSFMMSMDEDFIDGNPGELLVFKEETTYRVVGSHDCSEATKCLRSPYGEVALDIKNFTWDDAAEEYLGNSRGNWSKACFLKEDKSIWDSVLSHSNLNSSLKFCAECILSTMRVRFKVFDVMGDEERKTYFDNEVIPPDKRHGDTTRELDGSSLISIGPQGIAIIKFDYLRPFSPFLIIHTSYGSDFPRSVPSCDGGQLPVYSSCLSI